MKLEVLCLCLCIAIVNSSMYLTERELRLTRGTFCGPNLSGVLSVVCKGKYNSPRTPQKKSEYEEENEDFFEHPFLVPKRSAYNFLTDEVSKRGIVEECCLKSCSLKELRSYCR